MCNQHASTSGISFRTRHDFAREIYEACVSENMQAAQAYGPQHVTWVAVLRAAFRHTNAGLVTKEQWVGSIATVILSSKIECMPGSYRARLTAKRVVRLIDPAASNLPLSAQSRSLKRAAIEMLHREEAAVH